MVATAPRLTNIWQKVKATAHQIGTAIAEDFIQPMEHEQRSMLDSRILEYMAAGQWKRAFPLLQEMGYGKDQVKRFTVNYYRANPHHCPEDLRSKILPQSLPSDGAIAQSMPIRQSPPPPPHKGEASSASKLLTGLVESCLSIILAAPPGSGKTTMLHAWLWMLLTRKPKALVKVISFKNDYFMGLADVPGCVAVVDSNDLSQLLNSMNWIESVLNQRKGERSKPERDRIAQESPAWLVIPDWYVIQQALDRKTLGELQRRIRMVVTGGREFGVGIFLDTQSANLTALGFAEDSSIRHCLHLVALGKYTRNDYGKVDGGFSAILGTLNNRYMFPSSEAADELRQHVSQMDAHSRQTGAVGFIATTGGGLCGMMPNFADVMQREISPAQKAYLASQLAPCDNPFEEAGEDLLQAIGYDYRAMLARAVRAIADGEKLTESEIIKQVLKLGGRDYQQGRELLNELQSLEV